MESFSGEDIGEELDEQARREKYLRDLRDLANEQSGRDVGRIHRFTPEHSSHLNQSDKKKDDAAYFQAQMTAAERAQQRLLEAQQHIAEMYENAARTHDGRVVFWSEEHQAYFDEDGNEVDQADVDQSTVHEGNTTREEWDAGQAHLNAMRNEAERYSSPSRTISVAWEHDHESGIASNINLHASFTAAVAGVATTPDPEPDTPAPAYFNPSDLSL